MGAYMCRSRHAKATGRPQIDGLWIWKKDTEHPRWDIIATRNCHKAYSSIFYRLGETKGAKLFVPVEVCP